jgi:energy-coupling factor transporter ATP-binding protein EcfA2
MGSKNSRETSNQQKKSRFSIDSKIKAELARPQRRIKVLLLGTSDAGKSTLFKQVKIIYKHGFTNEEKREFKPILFRNSFESLVKILRLMNSQEIDFETRENRRNAKRLLDLEWDDVDEKEMLKQLVFYQKLMGEMMRKLWADNKLKIFHSYFSECQQKDSAN